MTGVPFRARSDLKGVLARASDESGILSSVSKRLCHAPSSSQGVERIVPPSCGPTAVAWFPPDSSNRGHDRAPGVAHRVLERPRVSGVSRALFPNTNRAGLPLTCLGPEGAGDSWSTGPEGLTVDAAEGGRLPVASSPVAGCGLRAAGCGHQQPQHRQQRPFKGCTPWCARSPRSWARTIGRRTGYFVRSSHAAGEKMIRSSSSKCLPAFAKYAAPASCGS
jgi:hypothetical protein